MREKRCEAGSSSYRGGLQPLSPPLALSPWIQIHLYLSSRGEEEAKAPPPPFPEKRRHMTVQHSSPLRCTRCRFLCPLHLLVPLLLHLLLSPPSVRIRVLLCVPRRRVDCCVYFVSSVPCPFRVVSAVPLRQSRNCQFPDILVQKDDCYVICDVTGAVHT